MGCFLLFISISIINCSGLPNYFFQQNSKNKYDYPYAYPWEQNAEKLSHLDAIGKHQYVPPDTSEENKKKTLKKEFKDFTNKLSSEVDVHNFTDMIVGVIEGLNLYTEVETSQTCVNQIEIFSTYGYQTWTNAATTLYYETVLNFTNALGSVSPMARSCNVTTQYLAEDLDAQAGNYQSLTTFYYMLKYNVYQNYTDMDARSEDLYYSVLDFQLGNISFDSSRLIYLFFLANNYSVNPARHMAKNASKHYHNHSTNSISENTLNPDSFTLNIDDLDSLFFQKEDIDQNTQIINEQSSQSKPFSGTSLDPSYPSVYSYFQGNFELLYEFILGTRLASEEQLYPCEHSITNYTINNQIAQQKYANANTSQAKQEALFEIFDTWMVFTPTTIRCYNGGLYMQQAYNINVTAKLDQPTLIVYNFLAEFHAVFSGIVAEIANIVYQDQFSFAFWLGDLVYRFLVVDHSDINIQFY